MHKQKFYIVLALILFALAFTTKVFASLTFSSTAITGDTATTIDLGSGHNLYLQTGGGNVGIGTTSPNANAILDVTSTTKAFMPPRMTTTQKAAIASPTEGMVVYDLTLHKLSVYTGSSWETVTSTP